MVMAQYAFLNVVRGLFARRPQLAHPRAALAVTVTLAHAIGTSYVWRRGRWFARTTFLGCVESGFGRSV